MPARYMALNPIRTITPRMITLLPNLLFSSPTLSLVLNFSL